MVVILIIGLLVSVVMPNLDFIWGDAQIRKAKIDVKQIHEAASLYQKMKGKLPENLTDLSQKDEKGQSMLAELPQDPWNNDPSCCNKPSSTCSTTPSTSAPQAAPSKSR